MAIKIIMGVKICLKLDMVDQELRTITTHSSEPISSSFQAICHHRLVKFIHRLIGLTTNQTLHTSSNKII
jgi:hypothetical protein